MATHIETSLLHRRVKNKKSQNQLLDKLELRNSFMKSLLKFSLPLRHLTFSFEMKRLLIKISNKTGLNRPASVNA